MGPTVADLTAVNVSENLSINMTCPTIIYFEIGPWSVCRAVKVGGFDFRFMHSLAG